MTKSGITGFLARIMLLFCLCILCLIYVVKRPAFTGNVDFETMKYVSADYLKRYVKELSETFLPRNCYHPGNMLHAAEYLKSRFLEFNPETRFQTYQINGNNYSNVVSNAGPDTKEIIVIGAHYDAYSSHPGADDNASGVAGLLEIARLLGEHPPSKRVVLVAYACEEPPNFATERMGSYIHADSIENKDVRLMISLEMIGYFSNVAGSQEFPISYLKYLYPEKGNFIAVVGEVLSNEAKCLKKSINFYTDMDSFSINAASFVPGVDYSDHRNYWALGYPAVMVTDTAFFRNQMYHKSGDTYDRLDYEKMAKVVYGVFRHIQAL